MEPAGCDDEAHPIHILVICEILSVLLYEVLEEGPEQFFLLVVGSPIKYSVGWLISWLLFFSNPPAKDE